MSLTLLLDADVVAYKIASVNETSIDWDNDGEHDVHSDFEAAKRHAVQWVSDLVDKTDATDVIVCLSDTNGRYFRHEFFPEYKGHRTGGRKPELLTPIKEFLADKYPSYIRPGLEADDILGILHTNPKLVKGESMIVTTDKDLRQVPGVHWDLKTSKRFEVRESHAEGFFYTQVLTGDTVDGFKGCPGVGPVRAKRIVSSFTPLEADLLWQEIVKTYKSKGLTESDALIQARVARILRHGEYDYKNKEPILWTPH